MSKVIVIQFVTLDGVTQDPDGWEGFAQGGWAFRFGKEAVAGDKFKLGPLLELESGGTLLLGRRTWDAFSQKWRQRTDDFSNKMNRIPKLVVSNTLQRVDTWNNSTVLSGNLIDEVRSRSDRETFIVIGSDSLVQELRRYGLVDEYRLLIFPIVLGEGRRLFPEGTAQTMQVLDVMKSGEAMLVRLSPSTPAATRGEGADKTQAAVPELSMRAWAKARLRLDDRIGNCQGVWCQKFWKSCYCFVFGTSS